MWFRFALLILLTALGSACGTKPPTPGPLGPETCNNRVDDNGDGKIDCFDPKCFQDAACRGTSERCDNDIDDNGDSLSDCADPLCAGQSCGFTCTCLGGIKVMGGTGGGSTTGGGSGGGTTSGGGTGGSGGGTGGSGGGTGGGAGGTGGSGGGTTGGGSGGGTTGGGSGGGVTSGGGTGGSGGGTTVMTETNCADNIDNDGDNLTDCADTNCVGITCGFGCTCALNRKTEVNCSDGASNDGDAQIDCADTDCFGAGAEICNDGIDNNCDRAIDCGDPSCMGSSQCTALPDGKPCRADGQCGGNKCFTELDTGTPNGACANSVSCTVGTNAGCHGGTCVSGSTTNTCYAMCTGTGVSGTGACRAGFMCFDPDSTPGNNNNYCSVGCTSNSECSGGGSGYGCNPWWKRCGNLDRGLGRYGAACTQPSQCEGGICLNNSAYPGGYCVGICRGDLRNCGPNGTCSFDSSWGDNLGFCEQNCATSSVCRQSENYQCFGPQSEPLGICRCLQPGATCLNNSWCCSGSCSFNVCN